MTTSTGSAESAGKHAPTLSDMIPPPIAAVWMVQGQSIPPQFLITHYSPDEWEIFVREWATGLETSYVQIKRLGGTGDEGVDVAAFKSSNGFEGPWDCFQAKHYAGPLSFADAFPEMLKLFHHVAERDYVRPDTYRFLAPRGCANAFNRLLSKPTELRTKFLTRLDEGGKVFDPYTKDQLEAVRVVAEATAFSIFCSVELMDALEAHRGTHYHAGRFGTPMLPRGEHEAPPEAVAPIETIYVTELVKAYAESHPTEAFEVSSLSAHEKIGRHFARQRVSFYSAEALRIYARESVPVGTFDNLKSEFHSGVVEEAEADHPSGLARLKSVIQTAVGVQLSADNLLSVGVEDRKGICHHLVNDGRLTWVKADS